jgi:hypothetical protein
MARLGRKIPFIRERMEPFRLTRLSGPRFPALPARNIGIRRRRRT